MEFSMIRKPKNKNKIRFMIKKKHEKVALP